MHELAITKTIITDILNECNNRKIQNPSEIVVEVGKLTSYVGESIQFYYNILIPDTPKLANCRLQISEVNGVIHCKTCQKDIEISDASLILCPDCKSTNVEIIRGKDIKIVSISDDK